MSASHPKRPSAVKMRSVAKGQSATSPASFNYLICERKQLGWYVEA